MGLTKEVNTITFFENVEHTGILRKQSTFALVISVLESSSRQTDEVDHHTFLLDREVLGNLAAQIHQFHDDTAI
ncbi:MAG: hypothetical protein OXE44_13035 [Nitrospinae bacterium]|nr:hypothetical protein [Nitrospinota bacterium]